MNMNKIWGSAVVLTGAFLVGCSDAPATAPLAGNGVRSDVAEVKPMDPVVAPAVVPAAYQPPVYESNGPIPTVEQSMTPTQAAYTGNKLAGTTVADTTMTPSASSTIGGKHIVRKGETLFAIAKAAYGDGKQWKKIVAANPGVSPSHLRVGQALVIP